MLSIRRYVNMFKNTDLNKSKLKKVSLCKKQDQKVSIEFNKPVLV